MRKCYLNPSVTMAWSYFALCVTLVCRATAAVRINFTSCQQPEWHCLNNVPSEIVYSCALVKSNDFIIHLKDYYTDHIRSVTVQNCRDLRVVLDCPILQWASQLQEFKVKDCDRLEFVSLSSNSLLQTPPEVTIENVREIVSFPKKLFKSPTTMSELKCAGSTTLRKIRVTNSKINSINTNAIYNVTGMKSIEFENVTIINIQNQAIEAIMGNDNSMFTIINSNIDNLDFKGITVHSASVTISQSTFGDIIGSALNITADYLYITGNTFKEICANGWILKSGNADITNNDISALKRGAFTNVKCAWKRMNRKWFTFSRNRIESIESHSLVMDYTSCKTAGTVVTFTDNKFDCKCRNIAFLNTAAVNSEFSNLIFDVKYNNTCFNAPCMLPVDVIKMLIESDMCQLKLDSQVMCLLYNDKHSNNEVTVNEDFTEPTSTFYVIGHANRNGDASAAMTAIDKDILRTNNLNMTNRTAVKVVFDSSRDFVETLRSTGTHSRPTEEAKAPNNVYVNRCVGNHCRNNAYDKQKALDFYKYVYAQLRQPKQNDVKKKKT
ncbi:uncharacterized protein LOC126375161 [Pectinophora gossypiella]|uniref:uncharacterized protein LOC126375161 n=1 Tax=Pectinophora gossypiella TaxID=13191 RepID=UPI00214F16E9|nr:uncharacterized protein LOC126375161 [Pectinophora gossypiella]